MRKLTIIGLAVALFGAIVLYAQFGVDGTAGGAFGHLDLPSAGACTAGPVGFVRLCGNTSNTLYISANGAAPSSMTSPTGGTYTTPNLVNPVITGPAPVACGATCSPTAGQLILLNQSAGSTVTIPTSAGTGNVIRMRITVALGSAAEKLLLTTVTDAIIGTAIGENGSTAIVFVGNAGTYHSLQMPFAGTRPSGGFVGDAITCTDIATGTWACDVQYQGGTTPTTPYSTSTT